MTLKLRDANSPGLLQNTGQSMSVERKVERASVGIFFQVISVLFSPITYIVESLKSIDNEGAGLGEDSLSVSDLGMVR